LRIDPDFQGGFDELYPNMLKFISDMEGCLGYKVYTSEDSELVLIADF